MKTSTLTLVLIGSARALTQAEPAGPFVEIGLNRSRTPV